MELVFVKLVFVRCLHMCINWILKYCTGSTTRADWGAARARAAGKTRLSKTGAGFCKANWNSKNLEK